MKKTIDAMVEELIIAGENIPVGSRVTLGVPLPALYTDTPVAMPVHVIRGRKEGPRLFVSAAVHGDELNGVEIIRRLRRRAVLSRLRGTLILVPVVNVYGLLNNSRYLPDRRDLNRSFPGSERGSLAARVAGAFMAEIVGQCTHGIDLHTGAIHRSNLPQIRADLDDGETRRLATAFGVPVMLNATVRDNSLREAAAGLGIPMLLYEAGQALRFDEVCIRAGERGVLNVLKALQMLPGGARRKKSIQSVTARSSRWLRAPASGLLRILKPLGDSVKKGELLGLVDDLFGDTASEVLATFSGIIIGRTEIPLVHEGEAIFHVARFADAGEAAQQIEDFNEAVAGDHAPGEEEPGLL